VSACHLQFHLLRKSGVGRWWPLAINAAWMHWRPNADTTRRWHAYTCTTPSLSAVTATTVYLLFCRSVNIREGKYPTTHTLHLSIISTARMLQSLNDSIKTMSVRQQAQDHWQPYSPTQYSDLRDICIRTHFMRRTLESKIRMKNGNVHPNINLNRCLQ